MKIKKPFRLAMFAGRFQHIHKAHEFMINTGFHLAEQVIIFIGEPNESRTIRNPFTYTERKNLIEESYTNEIVYEKDFKLNIYPLTDIKDLNLSLPEWCGYARSCAEMLLGVKPDLIIEGPDKRPMDFFKPEDMRDMSEFIVSENVRDGEGKINIRGTLVREFLRNNDFNAWKQCVNPKIHDQYNRLRNIILECKE